MAVPILFDRARLRQRRMRLVQPGFLAEEAARQAQESLRSIRHIFPRMATLGTTLPPRSGTTLQISANLSPSLLHHQHGFRVVLDEEWLPFAEASLDAIIGVWGLHWVNDVPGTLRQIHRALKPDGLFLTVIPGAETLRELRQSLAAAEAEIKGGVSPRIAPFPDVREAGALLQRAGFSMPVASSETLTATYPSVTALMHDLRSMGENNMLAAAQKTFTPRSLFSRTAQHYDHFLDTDGRLPATFEFITLTGWKSP